MNASINLLLLENTCSLLGVPLKFEKREGPATCLIILGIEPDTVHLELMLPKQIGLPAIYDSEMEPFKMLQ